MQVLIVEDDAALGLFLQKGLKLEGHEVSWVGDGEAALEHMQWSCPVLSAGGFSPRAMALVAPRVFVEEFRLLPLRVAGGRILYVGFEDRLDAVAALALEQMTE